MMKRVLLFIVTMTIMGCSREACLPLVKCPTEGSPAQTKKIELELQSLKTYGNEVIASPERLQNLNKSFEKVRSDSDDTIGFQVVIKGDAEAFARFGLQDGDVIWKINGISVLNRKRLTYWPNEILSGRVKAVRVTISRGKNAIHMHYVVHAGSVAIMEPTEVWIERKDKDVFNPPYEHVVFENGERASLLSAFKKLGHDVSLLKDLSVQISAMDKSKNASTVNIELVDLYLEDGTVKDVQLGSGLVKVIVMNSHAAAATPQK